MAIEADAIARQQRDARAVPVQRAEQQGIVELPELAPATLQKTHDHNFDEAVANLVLDAGRLTKSLPNGMH